jgi:hypothetical protein
LDAVYYVNRFRAHLKASIGRARLVAEYVEKGDLTFPKVKAELNRIAATMEELSHQSAQAYRVVGSLAAYATISPESRRRKL